MSKFLLQEIENVIHPLGMVWVLLVLGALVGFIRKHRRTATFMSLLAVMLWIAGGSRLADWWAGRLETFASKPDWDNLPDMDMVVMLGGVLNASPGDVFGFDLAGAADRAVTAIEFARRRPPKTLIFMGSFERGAGKAEGVLVKDWVEQWKVVPSGVDVRFGPPCRNTFEESRAIAQIAQELKATRIALVTSASHMRRATAVFASAGVKVFPVPCDFQDAHRVGEARSSNRLVPTSRRLQQLHTVLHEQISWNYYRFRGWIQD